MKKIVKYSIVLLFGVLVFSCSKTSETDPVDITKADLKAAIANNESSKMLFPNCDNRGFIVEPSVPEDSCCMLFQMLPQTPELPWTYWVMQIEHDDGSADYYYSGDYPENIVKDICIDETGFYQYSITYVNANFETLCESKNQVFYNNVDHCKNDFHLCWSANGPENTFQVFNHIGGMYIVDLDGNADNKIEWFDPELHLVGHMDIIYQQFEQTLINVYNLDASQVLLVGECTLCLKGSYPQSAFVALDAGFQSIVLFGTDGDGNYVEAPFYVNEWPE